MQIQDSLCINYYRLRGQQRTKSSLSHIYCERLSLKWKEEHKNKCEGMTKLNHQKLHQYIFQIQINCVDLFVCAHHNWEYRPVLFMCTNNSCKKQTPPPKLNRNPNLHVCSIAVTSFTGSHLHIVLQWQTTNAFIRTLIHLNQYFLQCFVLEFHVFKEAHLGKWISFIRRYDFTEIHFGNMP